MFRFLHSGVIVSILNATIIDEKSVKYDECCLTNGNQTRFIILIIVFLKLFFDKDEPITLKQNQINSFLTNKFKNNPKSSKIFSYLRYNKINQVVNFLLKNDKYLKLFIKKLVSMYNITQQEAISMIRSNEEVLLNPFLGFIIYIEGLEILKKI